MKRIVEGCEACQLYMRSQARDPHRLSLERVSRPMQAVGIDFFDRGGHKYLLLMDHFSGMPLFEKMGIRTNNDHTVKQLKRWFAIFGVPRSVRCDNGPPLSSMAFGQFCEEYGIKRNLTATYNPESSGAAERGVGLDAVRKDTTRAYQEQEEEELRVQIGGEVNLEEQQQGGEKQRRRGMNRNVEDVEPRRSARLAKKKVTMEDTEKEDNPEELPYYMEAVENGYAGTSQRNHTTPQEEEGAQEPTEGEHEEHPMREEVEVIHEEAMELSEESSEEP